MADDVTVFISIPWKILTALNSFVDAGEAAIDRFRNLAVLRLDDDHVQFQANDKVHAVTYKLPAKTPKGWVFFKVDAYVIDEPRENQGELAEIIFKSGCGQVFLDRAKATADDTPVPNIADHIAHYIRIGKSTAQEIYVNGGRLEVFHFASLLIGGEGGFKLRIHGASAPLEIIIPSDLNFRGYLMPICDTPNN